MLAAETTREERRSPLLALKIRDYRWYWFSGLGMTGAQNIQRLAIAWLTLDLTGSVAQLGLMVFVMGVPMSLVSLWGGVVADRYDRKKILVASQSFTTLNLAVLAALYAVGLIAPWHVYVSSVGLGAMQALTMPARNAMVRSLVGLADMKNAVALNSIQMQTAQVIWPSLAGVMISLAGVAFTLGASAALSTLGIVFLLFVRSKPAAPNRVHQSPLRSLLDGLAYSFSAPKVSTLMGMAIIVGFFGLPYMSMAPGFAHEELRFSAGETGLLLMATGIGSVVGSVAVLALQVRDNLRLYFVGSGFMGLSIALVALSPWAYLTFLPAAGFGFCLSIMIVGGQTLFQTEVPQELLGRVTSVWGLVAGFGFLASLPVGVLGEEYGVRTVLLASGLILVCLVVLNGLVRTAVLRPRRILAPEGLAHPSSSP